MKEKKKFWFTFLGVVLVCSGVVIMGIGLLNSNPSEPTDNDNKQTTIKKNK
ncbi:MAG: hypothetical protein IJG68_00435 [Bacilli bacterium]|nr:hypothetical protein [Bacilli bacterium]